MKEETKRRKFSIVKSFEHIKESINDYFQKILVNFPSIIKMSLITLIGVKILEANNAFSIISNFSISVPVYILISIFLIFSLFEMKISILCS